MCSSLSSCFFGSSKTVGSIVSGFSNTGISSGFSNLGSGTSGFFAGSSFSCLAFSSCSISRINLALNASSVLMRSCSSASFLSSSSSLFFFNILKRPETLNFSFLSSIGTSSCSSDSSLISSSFLSLGISRCSTSRLRLCKEASSSRLVGSSFVSVDSSSFSSGLFILI